MTKRRHHPRIATLIDMIPREGPWPEREQWFTSARHDFNLVFGVVDEPQRSREEMIALIPAAVREAVAHEQFKPRPGDAIADCFYEIAADGFATRDGIAIDPHEVPPGTIILDYRPQPANEFNPIMWKGTGAKGGWVLPPGVVIKPVS
jgi:hypothetical protein